MKFLKTSLAAFAAFALASCATVSEESAAEARPALWQVADEDTTIYLFGTIHTLPEGAEWRSPALEQAIAASSELVTEVRMDDQTAAAAVFLRLAFANGLPPVMERVPADKREALRVALEGSPIPAAALDRMKSWAVGITLAQVLFERAGLNPALGVEAVLTEAFRGKAFGALETVEQQLGFFDQLPEAAQRLFLQGVLETPEDVRREFDGMLEAWRSGDIEAIARTFNDEETLSPELREILLTRRNANWTEWLQRRLDRPGTIMVAVGAGHLAGPESVQTMLERRGVRVRRIQ